MVQLYGWRLRTKLADSGLLTARHGMTERQCSAARWDALRRTSSTWSDGGESEGSSFLRRGLLQVGCCMCKVGSVMPRAADELAPAVRCNLYDGLRFFLSL
jgi:hypothetical protein